jgi:hypothetical protein
MRDTDLCTDLFLDHARCYAFRSSINALSHLDDCHVIAHYMGGDLIVSPYVMYAVHRAAWDVIPFELSHAVFIRS